MIQQMNISKHRPNVLNMPSEALQVSALVVYTYVMLKPVAMACDAKARIRTQFTENVEEGDAI
jgi:hypothetical protein